MDTLDSQLLSLLKRDGRASIKSIAFALNITRTTARARLDRLIDQGEIVGFTVVTKTDVNPKSVRGLMSLEIEGGGASKTTEQLLAIPSVHEVHSTNGAWDLIAELHSENLEELDKTLARIREMKGVVRSETNLMLSSRRQRKRA